jgi:hypothetical protein
MGQYYLTIFLAEAGTAPKEHVRAYMYGHNYGNGIKLMEHSWIGNKFMNAVEHALSPEGSFYKSRVVWAGDYADEEPGYGDKNLFKIADDADHKNIQPPERDMEPYRFLVNHTKKLYVDKERIAAEPRYGLRVHPLSLLTAEGNGRGGGDYKGANEILVGSWARDVISIEKDAPERYDRLDVGFME